MAELYPRNIKEQIVAELDTDKIILITGPRQSGKTTLLEKISSELKQAQKQVYYYNFDRIVDLEFFSKQQKVEAFLRIRSIQSTLYVFIDEVQRKKDAGTFFKYFYDAGLNVKFVFSGSSSVELTDSFGDALTGRKRMFTLLPLSVSEIAERQLAGEWAFAEMGEPLAIEKLDEIISELLVWGCYPEVVLKKSEAAKLKVLGELYESYVQRDVKDLLRVKNVSGFNLLVKILAYNIGKPLVVEDLARQSGLHTTTINSYLDILEGTMIISRTDNYNPDFEDNLPKSKRFYFIDNGMRNYSLSQMQSGYRPDYRELAANLIFAELKKLLTQGENQADIYHYQTYSDNHIDFIIKTKTAAKTIPVVVRYPDDNVKLGKKIHEFINTKQPESLYIIGKELSREEDVKGCKVTFIPLGEFMAKLAKIIA